MTKAELQQLYWLRIEVEELSLRIRQLESALTGGISKLDGMPRAPGISDRIGDFMPEIIRLKTEAKKRMEESVAQVEKIETFINSIEDAQIRTVFRLRYVNCLSWQQVAVRLGGNTADSVRMMHNRYLQRLIDNKQMVS